MIEPIFSSKLFAVSSRKAEIRAAASNPINQNLMQQLSTALDKSYQKAEYLLDEEDQEKLRQEQTESVVPKVDETEESEVTEETSAEPKEHSAPPAKPSNLHSKFKAAEKNMSETESSAKPEDAPSDDVSVDTKTEAATDIKNGVEDSGIEDSGVQDAKSISDLVKTSLNDNEDTAGVSRTAIKDDELWVYYEDSINLNKVMASAIETLNNLDYGLEFNRLARSDNAIVFLM
jgi:hypothetical protein